MGKQISFIIDEDLEDEFIKALLKNGVVVREKGNNNLELRKSLPELYSENWFTVYFYKSEFGELVFRTLKDGQKYIDSSLSPVIEYIRTTIRNEEREISKGRLWIEPKYWDVNNQLQEKPKDLIQWYSEMSKWIKKNVPLIRFSSHGYEYKEHISTSLMQFVSEGYRIY